MSKILKAKLTVSEHVIDTLVRSLATIRNAVDAAEQANLESTFDLQVELLRIREFADRTHDEMLGIVTEMQAA